MFSPENSGQKSSGPQKLGESDVKSVKNADMSSTMKRQGLAEEFERAAVDSETPSVDSGR